MASKPHIKGKNAKLTFLLAQANAESKKLIVEAKSFDLEPDVTGAPEGGVAELHGARPITQVTRPELQLVDR